MGLSIRGHPGARLSEHESRQEGSTRGSGVTAGSSSGGPRLRSWAICPRRARPPGRRCARGRGGWHATHQSGRASATAAAERNRPKTPATYPGPHRGGGLRERTFLAVRERQDMVSVDAGVLKRIGVSPANRRGRGRTPRPMRSAGDALPPSGGLDLSAQEPTVAPLTRRPACAVGLQSLLPDRRSRTRGSTPTVP